jgi:hypothetical protein
MPEGDTIFRAARALNGALAGHEVKNFETVLPKLARVDSGAGVKGRPHRRKSGSTGEMDDDPFFWRPDFVDAHADER